MGVAWDKFLPNGRREKDRTNRVIKNERMIGDTRETKGILAN